MTDETTPIEEASAETSADKLNKEAILEEKIEEKKEVAPEPAFEAVQPEEKELEKEEMPAPAPVEQPEAEPAIEEKKPEPAKDEVKEIPVVPEAEETALPEIETEKEEVEAPAEMPAAKNEPPLEAPPSPPAPPEPKAAAVLESAPAVPFITQFLNRLKEFRMKANQRRSEKMGMNLEKIMEFANETQKVTNDDVERITGVGDRQALRYLKFLVKNRDLVRFGSKRNTFYKPIKK